MTESSSKGHKTLSEKEKENACNEQFLLFPKCFQRTRDCSHMKTSFNLGQAQPFT